MKPGCRVARRMEIRFLASGRQAVGNEVAFKPISLDMLVDSPVIAGEFYRNVDITPVASPFTMNSTWWPTAPLEPEPRKSEADDEPGSESGKLFGARHYRDYHFLLTLSDHVAHFGLEHHESNDSRLPERTLLQPSSGMSLGGLLAHEFARPFEWKVSPSRRPDCALLRTADEDRPAVGLRRAHGLPGAAGGAQRLVTPEQYRESIAGIAAALGPGRRRPGGP